MEIRVDFNQQTLSKIEKGRKGRHEEKGKYCKTMTMGESRDRI